MRIDLNLPGGGEFHFEKQPRERKDDDGFRAFFIIMAMIVIGMFLLLFWAMR